MGPKSEPTLLVWKGATVPRVAVRIAALVGGVTAVDLVTKTLAHARQGGSLVDPVNNPGLALHLVDVSTGVEVLVGLAALLGMGGWAVRRVSSGRGRLVTAGLLLGGAMANLTDRVILGSVRDFLPTPWLVFNLADVAMVVGVGLFYLDSYRARSGNPTAQPSRADLTSAA